MAKDNCIHSKDEFHLQFFKLLSQYQLKHKKVSSGSPTILKKKVFGKKLFNLKKKYFLRNRSCHLNRAFIVIYRIKKHYSIFLIPEIR
jgi:hypothetical protein